MTLCDVTRCLFAQLYEDAVELQLYFIRKRDETCKNGEVLVTPALSLTERRFHITVEQVRARRPPANQ